MLDQERNGEGASFDVDLSKVRLTKAETGGVFN
jgi:hypothetical protein